MTDAMLLKTLTRGSENALEKIIDKYNAYVCAVIRNTANSRITGEDVEETSSDVFFALWENAGKVRELKAWLGATARNKALNKLREIRDTLPLDREIPSGGENDLEEAVISEDEKNAVKSAILAMGEPDCEIFTRHYYDFQTVTEIAAETGMSGAKIKHRLARGREKLRPVLNEEVLWK